MRIKNSESGEIGNIMLLNNDSRENKLLKITNVIDGMMCVRDDDWSD